MLKTPSHCPLAIIAKVLVMAGCAYTATAVDRDGDLRLKSRFQASNGSFMLSCLSCELLAAL